MTITTAVYEVLNADATSTIHGNSEGITTTHQKQAWIKNLQTQAVRQVKLTDSEIPLNPGSKIGLAFLHDKQIIAFKRSPEIPVELAGQDVKWSALWVALLLNIPVIGYLAGFVCGLYGLATGYSWFGRRFYGIGASRLAGLVMLGIGALGFVQKGVTLEDTVHFHIALWVVSTILLVSIRFMIRRTEEKYIRQANAALELAWYGLRNAPA
ncbi:hypothetical protein NJC40_07005 [Pseudomonas sp. 21LCFQ02]|uniref:hypothetical protein n=1 Tax=Pseudomonas sp. 21LCFQ02 TaxID=2957505 RepID=UPI00209B2E3B|nr:hypothetical protein [Pseudomonas sp. 21LCFQ02]MCO8167521.1 hypothetical protein [Pseudomonas sp. 21LCFQ02]